MTTDASTTCATFADLEFDGGDAENATFKGYLDDQLVVIVSNYDIHDADHKYCGMLYAAPGDVPDDRVHYEEGEEAIFDGVLPDMMKFAGTLRFVKNDAGTWVIDPDVLAEIRKGIDGE